MKRPEVEVNPAGVVRGIFFFFFTSFLPQVSDWLFIYLLSTIFCFLDRRATL